MNQAMFSGNVTMEEAIKEKPAWIERLETGKNLEIVTAKPPALWFKIVYFGFGYGALVFGVYLLINGIIYSPHIRLH